MNTIHDQWVDFQSTALPKDAPPVQLREMRRSFYAGCFAFMMLLDNMSKENISEEASLAMMEGWDDEIKQFADRLKAGAE
jgi:GTPase SAR1 family protein